MNATISTDVATILLAQIQDYADKCWLATAQHKSEIKTLTTIADIENYNYKTGYPEKLNFTL